MPTRRRDPLGTYHTAEQEGAPSHPYTLAVDIGGTGLKASVLGVKGTMVADRVKVATPYPLPPDRMVAELTKLVAPLPDAERASVGFPGMVRQGLFSRHRTSSRRADRGRRSTPIS